MLRAFAFGLCVIVSIAGCGSAGREGVEGALREGAERAGREAGEGAAGQASRGALTDAVVDRLVQRGASIDPDNRFVRARINTILEEQSEEDVIGYACDGKDLYPLTSASGRQQASEDIARNGNSGKGSDILNVLDNLAQLDQTPKAFQYGLTADVFCLAF